MSLPIIELFILVGLLMGEYQFNTEAARCIRQAQESRLDILAQDITPHVVNGICDVQVHTSLALPPQTLASFQNSSALLATRCLTQVVSSRTDLVSDMDSRHTPCYGNSNAVRPDTQKTRGRRYFEVITTFQLVSQSRVIMKAFEIRFKLLL